MAEDSTQGEWEGYSIYRKVSAENHDAVTQAIDAHAAIVAMQSENHFPDPDEAREYKSAILGAAMRFLTELEREADRRPDSEFSEILDAWTDDEDSEGSITKLRQTQLRSERVVEDDWFRELVEQIHKVAWELGYIKAGRTAETTEEGSVDDPASEMTGDLANAATP
jgi:hypothetical protein